MTPTKPWKKLLVVGCSHGTYADPTAIKAVLDFKGRFKPHLTVHLGDLVDVSAFMGSNLAGGGDAVEPDVNGGLTFLNQLRPNVLLLGNHEDRLHRLSTHRNELVRYAAVQVLSEITRHCKRLNATMLPYSGNDQAYRVANLRLMHGTVYNENATRDMAESFAPWHGALIHAHTHRAGMATGRRADSPLGFCVGTLTRRDALDYAKCRRATLSWSQAFVWGYYSDSSSQLNLCQRQAPEWLTPIG